MTDLVVFLATVVLVGAAGIALGMIVARRIDRMMAPAPEATADPGSDVPSPAERPAEDHEEEQQS